jgi:crotonobetainyl-CoA:carnitine CoA-transferase CaiB-like acyl-CoA transferase
MQGPLFRMAEHDAVIAFTGRPHGADTDAVLTDLGYPPERIAALRAQGAV